MEGSESMSTVSREDNVLGLSSEDSSSPDESELELGLGLSLGCSGKAQRGCQYARILTAKDFPSMGSSSSSSCSSSALNGPNSSAGTKRSADSASQVVGWPPIRAYRMNSMVNQAKSTATEEYGSMVEKSKCRNILMEKADSGCDKSTGDTKEKRQLKSSLFVKVNMDGCQIGRKIDLSAHSSYETLANTLQDMFFGPTTIAGSLRPSRDKHDYMMTATSGSKLLNGSSDFVLTYEDREGDWMLVGDVPWGMFVTSVKRLRIMKTSEANGLDSRIQEKEEMLRSKRI